MLDQKLKSLFGDRTAPDGSLARDNFEQWFGLSAVKDSCGAPLVVYHGTSADFHEFSQSKAKDKEGRARSMGWGAGKFYFATTGQAASSSAEFAQMTGRGKAPNVMPVFLSIQKPMAAHEYMTRVQAQQDLGKARDHALRAVDKAILAEGFDGIIDEPSGGYAVFNSNQVKSALGNSGAFDRCSSSVTDSQVVFDAPDGHGDAQRSRQRS